MQRTSNWVLDLLSYVGNRISHRAFEYSRAPLKDLRGKYANTRIDVPRSLLMRAKRDNMIDGLLRDEFGNEAIDKYDDNVKEWNATKWFVES